MRFRGSTVALFLISSLTVVTPAIVRAQIEGPASDPVTVTTPPAVPMAPAAPPSPFANDTPSPDATSAAGADAPADSATANMKEIEPGVWWYEAETTTATGQTIKLWVYTPQRAIDHPDRKIPCVLIAPAGTPLIWGNTIGDGVQPEQVPYVRAGFYVIGYSIEGDCDENAANEVFEAAVQQFREAHAGITDTRAAFDYALTIPTVDPKRIYTAGHSSAATLALLATEYEPRIAGAIAYAPDTDIVARMPSKILRMVDRFSPGIRKFLINSSPINGTTKTRCPIFLFHADDDSVVPLRDNLAYYAKLSRTNHQVTFSRVPTGDHYDSMIQQGIPRGIAWLKKQTGE